VGQAMLLPSVIFFDRVNISSYSYFASTKSQAAGFELWQ